MYAKMNGYVVQLQMELGAKKEELKKREQELQQGEARI